MAALALAVFSSLQPARAQRAELPKVERIEITGTRIQSPNLESTSPIAVISAQDIKFEGVTRIEDMLNSLPQVFAQFGAHISNGATGVAGVNLRDLGSVRTLVLMNGKRLPIGSPGSAATDSAPDLNQIPAPLIQRIEVLTGGASAVYGSDAIAGVVNFIMRDNFEGVQGDVHYSGYRHNQHNGLASIIATRAAANPSQYQLPGDIGSVGENTEVSLLMGGNFGGGRGNATVFFDYRKDKPLTQDRYDYSACATGSPSGLTGNFTCGGSSTTAPGGRFLDFNTGNSWTINSSSGGVRPYSSTPDQFNFAPYNFYQRQDERYGFAAFAHSDVSSHARVYTEFNYHDDHTLAQVAPSGAFFGGVEFSLTNDNPLLSQAFKNAFGITATTPGDLFIGRRNIEGGPRVDDIRHTSARAVVGLKGDIFKNWDYDLYMQTARVSYQEVYHNDFSNNRIVRALDDVTDPGSGKPVCRAALDGTDPACVPYNIFTLGGVTPAAVAYVSVPGFKKGDTVQRVQGGTTSADLGNYGWRLPGSKEGIGFAIGFERRVDKLNLETDVAFTTGDLSGQGAWLGLAGQTTVNDYFAELRVPIQDSFSVNGSYRYSDYAGGKKTGSYGTGIELTPWRPIKLRGSYQHAVRAANVIERFTPQGLGLFNMSADPCGGPSPTASRDQCARSGLSAANYGNAVLVSPGGQYNAFSGGNPGLDPETAKTYTAGLVLQPTRNLSGSMDYFDINVEKVIGQIPAALSVSQCIFFGQFCDLVHRDPRTGALWVTGGFVTGTNINTAALKTSGVDVALNYNYNLKEFGGLSLALIGTWLDKFVSEPLSGQGSYDCAGLFGPSCGTPLPKWRHKLRTVWSAPSNFDLAVTWRHMDKVKVVLASSNPLLSGPYDQIGSVLGARDYMDIAVTWNLRKHVAFRFGVNNVFDRDPPVCDSTNVCGAPFGNGNTYPEVYDALGRKLFAGLTVNF